jgi:mRNA interferase MazF
MDPMRGEVWDAHVRDAGGIHPFVVLTINPMIVYLGSLTAVLVTGTPGPETSHVPLSGEVGLTEYDESFANATDLHTIPKSKFRRKRGRLHLAELRRLEDAVRTYLGL